MGDSPIVHHIAIDGIEGDGDGILRLRLAEIVRIAQQEIRKPYAIGGSWTVWRTRASCGAAVEMVGSGGVCEDFLILMRVQPCKAKLKIMLAVNPGEIILILVAPPRVCPWPVSVVHTHTDRTPTEIDSWDLIDRVGIKERRRIEAVGRVPGSGVSDENVVAVLVVCTFVQQVRADLVGGMDNTGPGRNALERPNGWIGIAGHATVAPAD